MSRIWLWARSLLMVASDFVFGAGFVYLGLVLFWQGWLRGKATTALVVILIVYVLNRLALILRIMGVPQALATPSDSLSENNHQIGLCSPLPHKTAEEQTHRYAPAPDTTKDQEGERQ